MSETSLAPSLLVAMPQLIDPNFHRTVVLIVHNDDSGSFGVVLNRATDLNTSDLLESLSIDWRGDGDAPIDWGGPVQPQTGWILFDPTDGRAEGDEVPLGEDVQMAGNDICFTGTLDILRDLAAEPPDRLRVLLGYAGWGPGQLETELTEGAWLVAPVSADVVFEVDGDAMWELVIRRMGIEPAMLAPTRGVH